MKTYNFSANYVGVSIMLEHLKDKPNRNTKFQSNEFSCLAYFSFTLDVQETKLDEPKWGDKTSIPEYMN